jgi:serine protease AprX
LGNEKAELYERFLAAMAIKIKEVRRIKMKEKDEKHQMPSGSMEESTQEGEMPTGEMEKTSPAEQSPASGMEESASGDEMSIGMKDPGSGDEMPGGMGEAKQGDEMPGSEMEDKPQNVLVEFRISTTQAASDALQMATGVQVTSFQPDTSYDPIPVNPAPDQAARLAASGEQTVIIRGTIEANRIPELEAQANVVRVWKDTPIKPFNNQSPQNEQAVLVKPMEGFGPCPIGTCDCQSWVAKGTIADVAAYLGVNQIWDAGYKGEGIVVGVVDGGITAQGRTINPADTSDGSWPGKLIPRVIGGWPTPNWGTTGVAWGWHGNMCATDVLGMAPNAQIYDIRISANDAISAALAGFQWAIDQHRSNGTPHILTNSWGIFQENWDTDYAKNPNHPFTRKVIEALDEGILILFAAGNCGGTCPDGRCGSDSGPGKSIWGANSHPRVITVGAVNKNEQFVGYSSQGPGALDPKKPNFCSITHFQGFFPSDSGTSAATPIAAGVVALLKQVNPSLSQDQTKNALGETAKDIGPSGWDQHSGAGIIRAKAAFDHVARSAPTSGPVVAWGSNRLDVFVLGTNSGLYHKWWNGSSWGPSLTGYEFMGGTIISDPEVVAWGPNRLDVFVIGTNSALYHKWWNGSAWGPSVTGYEFMGGTIIGQPKVVAWGANRLDVFVIGTNSALYHKWWNGSTWGPSLTGYENMGGTIIGNPEAVAWGANRLDVFVLGTNSGLYHKWWNGASWGPSLTGYEFMGGTIIGQPKVVAWGSNRLDVFVIGTDSALYHKWWNGSTWGPSLTGYENMGGTIIGSPEVVAWGSNRLDVFVVGTNSRLYHKWWNGSSWGPSLTGYEDMGGTIIGQPKVVAWGPNRLDVFVIGTDSALYHKWWDGSTWRPSLTGWEYMGGTIIRF